MLSRIFVALALATVGVGITASPAAADTCMSSIAEDITCTPVYAIYCAYSPKTAVACEQAVVGHCLSECSDDVQLVNSGATCTGYKQIGNSKQRTCVDPAQAPSCGAWSEGWTHPIGYWRTCYGTQGLDVACMRDICLA